MRGSSKFGELGAAPYLPASESQAIGSAMRTASHLPVNGQKPRSVTVSRTLDCT